jgi:hypothetical protein
MKLGLKRKDSAIFATVFNYATPSFNNTSRH